MPLKGRRVLVIEDEPMISMMLEDMLEDLGCQVVGPAGSLAAGLALAADSPDLDIALLDVNLGGQPVFPLADALRARGVPLVFCTGYAAPALRAADRADLVLLKPYREDQLAAALTKALGPAAD